ncbi:MAG: HAD family hydrolase [Bacteroidetes bacterium]|nr:MAG: HAD family hydrolase [Bacteroidota bacterium]
MNALQLFLFDIAGTVVQDHGYVRSCLADSLSAAGIPVDPATLQAVMGRPKPVAIMRLLAAGQASPPAPAQVEALHADYLRRINAFWRDDTRVAEIPGTLDVFAYLRKRRIMIGLETGFGRETTDILIERLGWQKWVDGSVCSDEVARGRPHPDLGLHLMRALGVRDPAQVAKVGDTVADLQEGAALDCALNIGVLSGSGSRTELEKAPHTHLLSSVADIPALLEAF